MGKNDDRAGVSDEEWARFMEQAAAGSGEAPKEPSARARMVTERLREERRRGQEPPGWRTGPAWQEMQGRGRRKRRLKAFAAVVLIAGLALIAVRPELVIDRLTGKAQARTDARTAAPLPAESVRPTAAPEELYPDMPTLKEPFRGSPAAQWADGAAGIELPEATAVGSMTKAQVADALTKVRTFLITANLDPATLRGERPAGALELLDTKLEGVSEHLEQSLKAPSAEKDPLNLFSRANPAELKPVGDVVKVRGRMWLAEGEHPGQAQVLTDYTFVYPFVKAKPGADQVERTIVRRTATFAIADPRKWQATPGKLRLVTYNVDIGNSACDRYDGFLHPAFDDDPVTGPTPSGTPVDPYDRSKELAAPGSDAGCGTVSRS
ncbi:MULTISPECIES: hypothetical protein [Streptomyces]|uniref:hypothetical protein n=1 Tax=Streptomyces TaxID=1883 RepID=UPI0029D01D69|nr:hypothetical protein [Streptomyces sp. F8]MDX6758109.1 hypothetical protein [Streptomyces sp. F8]